MNKAEAQDKALSLSHLLQLMWGVHSKYEGLNRREAVLYRVGVQTFLLQALDEVKELMEALEVEDDSEDDMLD